MASIWVSEVPGAYHEIIGDGILYLAEVEDGDVLPFFLDHSFHDQLGKDL